MKVYELAKDLGVDSITLIDKLKQLDIEVKSHMSSLGTEEVRIAKEHFAKEKAQAKKAAKTVRRKSAATTEEGAAPKKAAGTVIRRRAKASDETSSETPQEIQTAVEAQSIQEEAVPTPTVEEITTPVATIAATPQQEVPVEKATVSQPPVTKSAAATDQPAPVKPAAKAPLVRPVTTPIPPKQELKGSGLKMPSLLGARSAGQVIGRTSSILTIIKEDPIRKVTPQPKIPTASRPSGPGIVNLGKDAIDRMAEEESQFSKKKPGAKTDREKDPVDVKITDYRAKKELIFLPKKKKMPIGKEIKKTTITTPAAHKRVVRFQNTISVSDLAAAMSVKSGDLIKKLMGMGVMATLNHSLDFDTASLLAAEFKHEVENVAFKEESVITQSVDAPESLKPRPPTVTVMGHVDHGKTSLLDAIRSANVVAGEAGGITQHIGAYTVNLDNKEITFIDTPGHEAFTVMRARGANVTDIVVLVVAADDGVMPQTREAADHARAANVPIIVAVNKIDKPGANPDKVIKGLSEIGILSEAWGGENIFVNVSALKRTGIKELLEAILLQAEVLDLKANPDCQAEGVILEAKLDKNRGPIVNILVKKGTLKTGDSIVAGPHVGRVRAMTDDKGKQLKEVRPGYAAELLGLEAVPVAGDTFNAVKNDSEARKVASHRIEKTRVADSSKSSKMTLEQLFSKVEQGNLKELPVVLKSDVFGSTEAIKDSLIKLATEKVKVKILSASTGAVTESDVMLASASNAIILGFNVRPDTKARALAESEGVDVKTYSIIYELFDDVKKAMAGLLDKKELEKYLGRAEVRETFSVPKVGVIAGCSVIDGKITRGCQVRLLRDGRVVFTGKLSSLKRFKDDAKEVAQGYECGMGIENYNDLKPGDLIEAFSIELIAQELGPTTASQKNSNKTSEPARV